MADSDVLLISSDKSLDGILIDEIKSRDIEGNDNAFYVSNLGDIITSYRKWKEAIPRAPPFYAVKCNDNNTVLKILADLGASFDCASKTEIEKVLNLGVSSGRIIYAHPCKQISFLRYAKQCHVTTMTFDNEAELYKIKSIYPEARLVLRFVATLNFKVMVDLGKKFGCRLDSVPHLLKTAKTLNLNVIGVSFHVGSGCQDGLAYQIYIKQARDVFDVAMKLDINMTLLDIGGGFPSPNNPDASFVEMARVVNMSLDKYFPAESGVDIIAEPGTYFVQSAFTLVINIIGKRTVYESKEVCENHVARNKSRAFMYYVNDGLYGSFAGYHMYLMQRTIKWIKPQVSSVDVRFVSSIWGPTCDSIDCIREQINLPEMNIGDRIYIDNIGDYSLSTHSGFNGMPKPECTFYCRKDVWWVMQIQAIVLFILCTLIHGQRFTTTRLNIGGPSITGTEVIGSFALTIMNGFEYRLT